MPRPATRRNLTASKLARMLALFALLTAALSSLASQSLAQRPSPLKAPQNAASTLAQPLSSNPASFDYLSDRQSIVSLDGQWRFHSGDDPHWSDPAFDDAAWTLLHSDQPWSEQGFPGLSGFGWYRFAIAVPAPHPALALELAPIMTSYQVFVDGRLAASVGHMPPNIFPTASWDYQSVPLAEAVPSTGNSSPGVIHIAIRVWHSPIWASYMGGGPAFGDNLFGNANLIATEQRHHDGRRRLLFVDLFAYAIVASIISVSIFGLYLFRPKEREYLWFAIVLMASALDAALTIAKEIYAFPAIPVFDLFDGILNACSQAALLLFLSKVLRIRRGLIWETVFGLALLSSVCGALYWPGWLSVPVSALLQLLLLLPSSIWMLATLAIQAIRRDGNARLLLVPVALVQGLYAVDNVFIALNQFGLPVEARLIETPFVIAPYTMHPALLAQLLFVLAMLGFLIRRFTIARRREERWEGALEAARQVQNLLLPEAIPQVEGFAIDCIYRPAESVGGDFFQILPCGDGDLLIVVGDVAGKGLPAAMMVSMIVGVIRAEAAHTTDPAQLASALNDHMTGRSAVETGSGFTTCLCAHLSANGHLVLANAGHLPPYRNGHELAMPGALPLGMLGNLSYDPVSTQLQPGDRLTFVSDGVVEAQNKSGELLGFDRTEKLSTRPAAEIAETANRFGQVDDITVVTIEFRGAPQSLPLNLAAEAVTK